MPELSHTDADGKARMVDVGDKEATQRSATASITLILNRQTYDVVKDGRGPKGDVLTVAKLAGIQAAKKTAELIPLCHQIGLDHVDIGFEFDDDNTSIIAESTVKCTARTGVEMEALTACSVTALAVYDMLKAVQKDICISNLVLIRKSGGKSDINRNADL